MSTKYPAAYDDFEPINDASERNVNAADINSVYDSLEALESEIGAGIQGASGNFAERYNASFDASGNFRKMQFKSAEGQPPFSVSWPSSWFSEVPEVQVQASWTGNFSLSDHAIIVGIEDLTTSGCTIVGKKANGGNPSASFGYDMWLYKL